MRNDTSDWRSSAEHNATVLKREIGRLSERLGAFSKVKFKDFWDHVEEINTLFKELKPLLQEERERLWSEFGNICTRAKAQQQREHESRQDVSRRKRELVQSKLNEAYHQAKGSRSAADLRTARELLQQAFGWMKDGWENFNVPTQLFTLNDGKMSRDDHAVCWERYQEVRQAISDRRSELCDSTYDHFKRQAYEASGLSDSSPREAKQKIRDIQANLKGSMMEGWQFDEVRQILEKAYANATAVAKRRHAEWESKQDEWRQRLRGARSRKLELIEKNQGVIARLEDQISNCYEMQRNARTSEHENRVQGWIDEKRDKIRDIERSIDDLERDVREIDGKLAE